MGNRLSRRTFLKAGAVGLAGAALAACVAPVAPAAAPATESGGSSAPAAESVALRLSAWADVQDAVVYENIVKAYSEKSENAD